MAKYILCYIYNNRLKDGDLDFVCGSEGNQPINFYKISTLLNKWLNKTYVRNTKYPHLTILDYNTWINTDNEILENMLNNGTIELYNNP